MIVRAWLYFFAQGINNGEWTANRNGCRINYFVAYAYPLLLDVADRLVVIVGGGNVAARKAGGLIAAGARRIRCVALEFSADLPAAVDRIKEQYASRHLEGAGLVFAATDRNDVNDAVVRDARERGILVNRADADDAEPGDFATPAKLEQGAVIVSVSAGSAALSAAIRDDLARKLDARFVKMADAMKLLRPVIRTSSLPPDQRAMMFRELAADEALSVLDAGGIDALRGWLAERYPELKHA
ncbi:MAG: precorrin-2 dehydrogenase and sirohydrochlorin ferrochelatase [Phycisphaerales bacterium]|nr:precorrin-2 dehydrogenase and sirohydrochlorin ferrochelatase [Phycisphaerales bacterium]